MTPKSFISFLLMAAVLVVSGVTNSCRSSDENADHDTGYGSDGDTDTDSDSDGDGDADADGDGFLCPSEYTCVDSCSRTGDTPHRDFICEDDNQTCCERPGAGGDADSDADADPTTPCPTSQADYECILVMDCTGAGGEPDFGYYCQGTNVACCDVSGASDGDADTDTDTDADADLCPEGDPGVSCETSVDCRAMGGDFLSDYHCPNDREYCCQSGGGDGDGDTDTDGDADTDGETDTGADTEAASDSEDTPTETPDDRCRTDDPNISCVEEAACVGENLEIDEDLVCADDNLVCCRDLWDTDTDTPLDTESDEDTGTGIGDTDDRPLCDLENYDFLSCVPAGECGGGGQEIDPTYRCEDADDVCCATLGPPACPTDQEGFVCVSEIVCRGLNGTDVSETYDCSGEGLICCQEPAVSDADIASEQ